MVFCVMKVSFVFCSCKYEDLVVYKKKKPGMTTGCTTYTEQGS